MGRVGTTFSATEELGDGSPSLCEHLAPRQLVMTAMIGQRMSQPSAVRDVRQGGSAQKRQRA